jgi:hypothetical protein
MPFKFVDADWLKTARRLRQTTRLNKCRLQCAFYLPKFTLKCMLIPPGADGINNVFHIEAAIYGANCRVRDYVRFKINGSSIPAPASIETAAPSGNRDQRTTRCCIS